MSCRDLPFGVLRLAVSGCWAGFRLYPARDPRYGVRSQNVVLDRVSRVGARTCPALRDTAERDREQLRTSQHTARSVVMPIASPDAYAEMLDRAKAGAFAYPAINVTSSQTLNAALQGFAEAESD